MLKKTGSSQHKKKCIHGISSRTCSVCKNKPEYNAPPNEKPDKNPIETEIICITDGCENPAVFNYTGNHEAIQKHGHSRLCIFCLLSHINDLELTKQATKLDTDPYLSELRNRLKDAKTLCQAISMVGNTDSIKTEIRFYLQEWA